MKLRLLVRWWLFQSAALFVLIPAVPALARRANWQLRDLGDAYGDEDYVLGWLVTAASVALLQWLFLLPVHPPERAKRPARLVWSMIVGALLISLLFGGALVGTLGVLHNVAELPLAVTVDEDVAGPIVLAVLGLNWIVATPLLVSFTNRSASPERFRRRLAAILFAGSAVEVLAGIPLDVLASRRESCWCGRGTWLMIVVGLTVGTILFGPYVVVALVARHHRRWPDGRCAACGGAVGPDRTILACPHCGSGFRAGAGSDAR